MFPYFLSAQLDGFSRDKNVTNWELFEGGIGLFLHVMTFVAAVVIDVHLLAFEFVQTDSYQQILQTGALITLATSAATVIFFVLVGACNGDSFSSTREQDASFLPPFATSLICGNLRSTLIFSALLLLAVVMLTPESQMSDLILKLLVAQITLKSFGMSMALSNHRLKGYSSNENVFSAS